MQKRALKVFSTTKEGYTLVLKRMKYMFGQISQISQAYISKLTLGKPISNRDEKSHLAYYNVRVYFSLKKLYTPFL